MHELVLVVSDLYLSREPSRQDPGPLPGLEHVTRFGTRSILTDGWRPWLARWLTGAELGAPASVAAHASARFHSQAAPPAQSQHVVWIATPVHLITGMSSLHFDSRSVLRLDAGELTALATGFREIFHDSGFTLEPLESGDFLLLGPQSSVTRELEPARVIGESVADAQHGRASDPKLRRLGAEIEMWLHDHPINAERVRRGRSPVTGLWLWGSGPIPAQHKSTGASAGEPSVDVAFGSDAYLHGLWASTGRKVLPLPQQLEEVFSYPGARRAALVTDMGSMLHSAPTWTLFDALAQIDRVLIAPAVKALGSSLDRLILIANDRQFVLRSSDRFKLWRRTPTGLSGLQ